MAASETPEFDNIFRRLESARRLEAEGTDPVEAATKYYEAIYMMRQALGSLPEYDEPKRRLLQEQIHQFDKKAKYLVDLMRAEPDEPRSPNHSTSEDASRCAMSQQHALDTYRKETVAPASDGNETMHTETPLQHSSLWKLHNSIRKLAADQVAGVVHRANIQLARAIELDELDRNDQAVVAYAEAASEYLNALHLAEEKQRKLKNRCWDEVVGDLKKRLNQTLQRAEQLKEAGFGSGSRSFRLRDVDHQQHVLGVRSEIDAK